jgi:NhaA family Na+:H+ antiporter
MNNTPSTETSLPVERFLQPFQRFARLEASSGLLLLTCAIVALAWANSPWAASYHALWQTPFTVGGGALVISKPLILWINDALMAIFFLVVGLEIKREVLVGQLASVKRAALPVAAALGGMIVPALIYVAFTMGSSGVRGWGIPMATDIAFSLGVLALLGSRAPLGLKIFLAAFAIADDIGAVLVIAFFYTAQIAWAPLIAGGVFFLLAVGANLAGVRSPTVYFLLGIGLWVGFLKSGVHATIAGVLLALTIPAWEKINPDEFVQLGRDALDEFEHAILNENARDDHDRQQGAIETLETACEAVQTPLLRVEHMLHGWVSYFIMPLFALANAGVSLAGGAGSMNITLGVAVGLILGKQVGVTLFSFLAVKTGLADLPEGVTWKHVYGVSLLAGIGFTMSLFVADLAFGSGAALDSAKLGILGGSLLSGIGGYLLLRSIKLEPPARSRAEAGELTEA